MLDAVFNHSGTEFAPWKDVLEHGPQSRYWDWFFVNKWPLPKLKNDTNDGKYYSFAFTGYMPKLNTNNPEVIAYFQKICRKWVEKWNIDGIRFDVGNEVSHRFLKELNRELKAVRPDVFLLGEIWHDSVQWLQGDEYDSVMNYPFLESIQDFWAFDQSWQDLKYALNRCYTLYTQQVSELMFNFLDTHDTMRSVTRCGGQDVFYQQLTLLMTMPGSACIYYGTEIALEGGDDPDCRRPMPWHRIEAGECRKGLLECSALIALRKAYPETRRGRILWRDLGERRLICYDRMLDGGSRVLRVVMNAEQKDCSIPVDGQLLYSRNLSGNTLAPGGIAIMVLNN
jgi:glycosidase